MLLMCSFLVPPVDIINSLKRETEWKKKYQGNNFLDVVVRFNLTRPNFFSSRFEHFYLSTW